MSDRVQVTKPIVGICHMQVCAERDATDEEILAVCNRENPAGTELGWATVIRNSDDNRNQRPCADNPQRTHFLVAC